MLDYAPFTFTRTLAPIRRAEGSGRYSEGCSRLCGRGAPSMARRACFRSVSDMDARTSATRFSSSMSDLAHKVEVAFRCFRYGLRRDLRDGPLVLDQAAESTPPGGSGQLSSGLERLARDGESDGLTDGIGSGLRPLARLGPRVHGQVEGAPVDRHEDTARLLSLQVKVRLDALSRVHMNVRPEARNWCMLRVVLGPDPLGL